MRKAIKREKLLRNSRGQYRYLFNWVGGGFNDVWASNITEFRAEIKYQFAGLTVAESTIHRRTPSESEAWDRAGNMMCW